jgi:4,4'-diaponeurosporenoate glycosyltransferase
VWFSWRPSCGATALFLLGWGCGWILFWRPRPLAAAAGPRPAVAVIVPARDEATTLPALLPSLLGQLHAHDELVVVDDHSSDGTASVAAGLGARVIAAPALPDGWTGKCWACDRGVRATSSPVLVFLDADVTLDAPDALDRLAGRLGASPARDATLVTVQPWHRTARAVEQLSLLFNVTALMGSAAFTPLGERVRVAVAFGPVLACTRSGYVSSGGHAHPEVRGAVAEDLALADRFPVVRAHTGRPSFAFRMYPRGVRELVAGWTKNIATGAVHIRWWFALAVVGWIWSLSGGWLTSPWFYAASVAQLVVLGRRAGRFGLPAVLLYPVLTLFFLVVFVRSVTLTVLARPVGWKERSVATRRRP